MSIVTKDMRLEDLLVELALYDSSQMDDLNIVLLSDNDDFKKLNYFIFSNVDGINYSTMDTPYDKDLSILSEMDMIIFYKNDQDLEEMILKNIHKKRLNTKFFHVIDNKNYRKVDLLNEYLIGVNKIIKIDTELEEYIFEIQKELRRDFYSKRLQSLKEIGLLSKKEDFEKRVNELIEKRVFFTKLRYHYDSDLDIFKYNIRKIVRKKDTIYIDKDKNEIFFLLLNIMPKKASQIIRDRIKNFSIRISEISQKSVFDLIFE